MPDDLTIPHERVVTFVQTMKNEVTLAHGIGNDMPPLVLVGLDGHYVSAMANEVDRDMGLAIARFLITALGAEFVILAVDAYMKKGVQAEEAEQHEEGSFQRAFPTDPTITEMVGVMTIDRTGHAVMSNLEYVYKGRRLEWTRTDSEAEGLEIQGRVFGALRDALQTDVPDIVRETRDEIGLAEACDIVARMANSGFPTQAIAGPLHKVLPRITSTKRTRR